MLTTKADDMNSITKNMSFRKRELAPASYLLASVQTTWNTFPNTQTQKKVKI